MSLSGEEFWYRIGVYFGQGLGLIWIIAGIFVVMIVFALVLKAIQGYSLIIRDLAKKPNQWESAELQEDIGGERMIDDDSFLEIVLEAVKTISARLHDIRMKEEYIYIDDDYQVVDIEDATQYIHIKNGEDGTLIMESWVYTEKIPDFQKE